MDAGPAGDLDRRGWATLIVVVCVALMATLDTTVLTVAIPTIIKDFHTNLAAVQWVVTGYSLTFASLLIVGGRIGDLFGSRRVFMIGLVLFATGSAIAAASTSVPMLIGGEALIEGVGAALMTPASLSILSTTFTGPERSLAFAAWGTTSGFAVAFGPPLGGWLTTVHSWRWAFGINVVIAPLALLASLLFVRPDVRRGRHVTVDGLDVPGAALISTSMLAAVLGLGEGGRYGWWKPIRVPHLRHAPLWPTNAALSVVPIALALAAVLFVTFCVAERRRAARWVSGGAEPLFDLNLLRVRAFRFGLATTGALAMAQLSFVFVLPIYLQDARHQTAAETGMWLVPFGVAVIVGAQVGGRLTRRVGPAIVIRSGALGVATGLLYFVLTSGWRAPLARIIVPALVLVGVGAGFATSQLSNIVLTGVPPLRSGAASGAAATVRQLGGALAIAVVASVLAAQTARSIERSVAELPPAARAAAAGETEPSGASSAAEQFSDVPTIRAIHEKAVADAARTALASSLAFAVLGAAVAQFLPRRRPPFDDSAEIARPALLGVE